MATGSYAELWDFSVAEPAAFWDSIWDYFGVLGQRGTGPALTGPLPDTEWFPGATLNYARNALRMAETDPGRVAIIAAAEDGEPRSITYGELAAEVARVQAALRELGVTRGDRVAGDLPTVPESLIALLATASLGAIWSSCSPDFGAHSVIDRFAQITPKVLVAVAGYRYNGRAFGRADALAEIVAGLPGLHAVIMVGGPAAGRADGPQVTGAVQAAGASLLDWDQLPGAPGGGLEFDEVPFSHPLWVLYSSGTTGLPKAIMHGHGGVVLEHLKALSLHQDLGPDSVFFWYTTTGWMMWNYLAGGLLVGATVVLYDGSATYPGTDALWRLAARTGVTYFGTGAPYLLACAKAELSPGRELDLAAAARHRLDRVAAAPGGLRLGLPRGRRGPATRLVLRRHRPVHRVRRAVAAAAGAGGHHRRALPGRPGRGVRRVRPAGHRRGRRAGHHRADAVHAGRLLERSRPRALPRQLLRRLSRGVAARGLDHPAAGRRLRDLRAVGRHAEPGRRADGHQRVLPGRGAAAGDHRQPGGGHRAAGPRRGGWCCMWCWPTAARWTTS